MNRLDRPGTNRASFSGRKRLKSRTRSNGGWTLAWANYHPWKKRTFHRRRRKMQPYKEDGRMHPKYRDPDWG